jgi:hypothetical protein
MSASLDDAVKKIGGARKVAAKMKVSHQAVYVWIKRGWAPMKRAIQLERMTGIPRAKLIDPQIAKLLNI